MYKLQAHSLNRTAWFSPETYAPTLEEKNSQAKITLGPDDLDIATGDWILDTDLPGGWVVWRVKTVEWRPDRRTRQITMEHAIKTLSDTVMFGEVTAETISGGESCTAKAAAQYILGKQSDWVLGSFAYSSSAPFEFDSEKLFDALELVTDTLDGAWWQYDMSVYPFKISIVNRDNYFTALSEMRGGRNIATLRRTVDRSKMYTRFYPIGKDDLHISGDYVSKNENIYGTISKVETDQSRSSETMLRLWANERLRKHAEPAVTITISGSDLSSETGEDIDKIILGRPCRVPLPEYGTTIQEHITKIAWKDRMQDPKGCTVTLANQLDDVASIFKQETSSGSGSSGRGGRAGAKNNGEKHAWIIDENDHVGLIAEAIIGRDPDGNPVDWSRVSSIIVDGEGIHQKVVATENDIVVMNAAIEVTEQAITQEVTDRRNADQTLSGRITVEAGKITQIVDAVGSDGTVTAASIVMAINDSRSSVVISADHIELNGETIAEKLSALDLEVGDITSGINRVQSLVSENTVSGAGLIANEYIWCGDNDISNPIMSVTDGNYVNNSKTVTFTHADGEEETITFSRATVLDGSWDSGRFTTTASPQGDTLWNEIDSIVANGTVTYSNKVLRVPIKALGKHQGGNGQEETGYTQTLSVAAGLAYNDGETQGKQAMGVEIQTDDDGTKRIHVAESSTKGYAITLSTGSISGSGTSGKRTITVKAGSTTLHTKDITDYGTGYEAGYRAGWNAARGKVSRSGNKIYGPKAMSTSDSITAGQAELRFTANYTASSHSYTASSYTAAKYTASSYTKETHSYTASSHSHSFTQASYTVNDGTRRNISSGGNQWTLSNGSILKVAAASDSDSYTASKHSYTASTYTASTFTGSSYTKETHSYTASSFSWTDA